MLKLHALVRLPDNSLQDAIPKKKRINLDKAFSQHKKYVEALLNMGVDVFAIQSHQKDPDGVFVEDTAVVLRHDKAVIITNPAPESRKKELQPVIDFFRQENFQLYFIEPPGTLEGGDVISVESSRRNTYFIGLSGRTNEAGFEQFRRIVRKYHHETYPIEIPKDALHLKSIATYCGKKDGLHIFICRNKTEIEIVKNIFRRSDFIETIESNGANILMVNNVCFVSAHCIETKRKLFEHGLAVQPLDISEFAEKDGSLTCLSILY